MTNGNPKIRLYHASAIDVLRGLPAGNIDAAVFDPPYPTIFCGCRSVCKEILNFSEHVIECGLLSGLFVRLTWCRWPGW